MSHKASKGVGTFFLAIICLVLGYYGWYYYFGPGQQTVIDTKTADNAADTIDKTETTTTSTPTTTTPVATPSTDTTVKLTTFSKTGFNFTFQYPSTWKITSAIDSSDKILQKTIKITTDTSLVFQLDNPAVAVASSGYSLNHAKDIKAASLTFSRNYGANSNNQILYLATYTDPNNFDASSISFSGSGTIDDKIIESLDTLISSFQFK